MGHILVIVLCITAAGCSQWHGAYPEEGIEILTYNVQDLFDAQYDGDEYPEYDPRSGRWDAPGYHLRLSRLRDVVARSGYPDIILLQEIEKPGILDDLVTGYLYGQGYRYRGGTSTQGSAIEVGILSRYPVMQVLLHRGEHHGESSPRPTMEVVLDTPWGAIHVLNAHWKSKIDGDEQTEPARRACASVITGRAAEIREQDGDAYIIAGGDFNTTPYESGCYPLAVAQWDGGGDCGAVLYITGDPAQPDAAEGVFFSPWLQEVGMNLPGTYMYRGDWEAIDHLLFCENFFTGESLEFCEAYVVDEQLLDAWGSPAGWNLDNREGYSDHLPLGAVVR